MSKIIIPCDPNQKKKDWKNDFLCDAVVQSLHSVSTFVWRQARISSRLPACVRATLKSWVFMQLQHCWRPPAAPRPLHHAYTQAHSPTPPQRETHTSCIDSTGECAKDFRPSLTQRRFCGSRMQCFYSTCRSISCQSSAHANSPECVAFTASYWSQIRQCVMK